MDYPPENDLGRTIAADVVLVRTDVFALVLRSLVAFREGLFLTIEAFRAPDTSIDQWNDVRGWPPEGSDVETIRAHLADERRDLRLIHGPVGRRRSYRHFSSGMGAMCYWDFYLPLLSEDDRDLTVEWVSLPGGLARYQLPAETWEQAKASPPIW